ncbi:hypothetical protein [Luethyella okanaganae]|uniref:Histidine kinase n=1 Tax=Luethyella okanaganae TaxID=69372 RepID=A0ABW1VD73_9MICO
MSEQPSGGVDDAISSEIHRRAPRELMLLSVLLFAEAALLVVALVWLVVESLTERPALIESAVAIIVLTAVALVFVLAVAIGSLRRSPWIRGGAVTWQLLQIAVAVGCFQGTYARPEIGWALIVPSLLVIGLLLSPRIRAEFVRDGEPGS